MITIKNNFLTAEISEQGAELKGLYHNSHQYVWQGDPEVWKWSSPIMFPICCGLKDNEYVLDGKVYSMPRHGFARGSLFEVEAVTEGSVTLLLKSSEATKASYPFDFELRVTHALKDNSIVTSYNVKNLSDVDMYFSIGCHEGFSTPEGIDQYDVVFAEKGNYYSHDLDGGFLEKTATLLIKDGDTLHLSYDYFDVDTLVFDSFFKKSVTFRKRDGSRELRLDFDDFKTFLIWTKKGAKFVCLEPCDGDSDYADTDKNIKTKSGIQVLSPYKEYQKSFSLTVIK